MLRDEQSQQYILAVTEFHKLDALMLATKLEATSLTTRSNGQPGLHTPHTLQGKLGWAWIRDLREHEDWKLTWTHEIANKPMRRNTKKWALSAISWNKPLPRDPLKDVKGYLQWMHIQLWQADEIDSKEDVPQNGHDDILAPNIDAWNCLQQWMPWMTTIFNSSDQNIWSVTSTYCRFVTRRWPISNNGGNKKNCHKHSFSDDFQVEFQKNSQPNQYRRHFLVLENILDFIFW